VARRHDLGEQGISDGKHAAGGESHHDAHENVPGEGERGSADEGADEEKGRWLLFTLLIRWAE